MPKKLILTEDIFNVIISSAIRDYPRETCGIIASDLSLNDDRRDKKSNDGVVAREVYPLKNVSDNPAMCYLIDPLEQLKVFKDMRNKGLELVGIYHSHIASEAYPSERDVKLAFYPEAVYVIVSLADKEKPVLRAFNISQEKGSIEEIEVVKKI